MSFRWLERREPLNSDDMIMFEFSTDAAAGQHWLFGAPLEAADATEANPTHAVHTAFRIGLLPISVPAIALLGESAAAYYLTPLIFSLIGFCALFWLMLRQFGPRVALVFAAIHLLWPFELEHASLFLTDLPAAAMGIVSLCLLDASANRTPRGRIACAVLAGLAAWETYLLRNNGVVLLAPAYLVFLWSRSTRMQTLAAMAVAALGVVAQQALLALHGFGWGYDWLSVRRDFAEYVPFLPVYSWGGFLVRQFTYQMTTFGRGLTGITAALLVLGSLGAHLLLLRFEKRSLLRAVAAFGLFSWLVFSFSIYERVPGGVRATVPVNFRFVQPFTYSSLVVWAWAWCSLQSKLAGRGPSSRTPWLRSPQLASALPLLLVVFSLMALVVRWPRTYAHGETQQLGRALERRLDASREPRVIVGTRASLRVPRIFADGDLSEPAKWRELTPSQLGDWIETRSSGVVLRDIPRELSLARYLEPEARRAYRNELARIEELLWRDYRLAYVDVKYALFEPSPPGSQQVDTPSTPWVAPSTLPPGAELIVGLECKTSTDPPDSWRTLIPAREGGGRACERTWLGDGREPASPGPPGSDASPGGFVARLQVDYDAPLTLTVDVIEHREGAVRRQRIAIPSGTSYVPVRLRPGIRALSLVYRVSTREAAEGQVVRVLPAEWHPYQFADDEGELATAPTGGSAS